MTPGCRRSSQQGSSLLELTLVMAITTILAVVAAYQWDTSGVDLTAAHQDISGSLDQALSLARARGSNVTVAVGKASGAGEHLPVQLSRRVKWGKPANVPVPPGMDMPTVAAATGEAHKILTVTPRHTTVATAWFLNDGKDALCLRLNNHGRLQVLRWRHERKSWMRV